MNNDSTVPAVLLPTLPGVAHADDTREVLNRLTERVNFLTDRYNGEPLPLYDPVSEWASQNSMGHMSRAVQEAAYNAANPNAKIPTAEMDPVELYASQHALSHLPRAVQEAAWAADGNAPREPFNEA